MGTVTGGIVAGLGSIIGGRTSSKAAETSTAAQLQGNREAREQIQQNIDRARRDALGLFGQSQQNQRLGFSESLGLLGQSIPEQGRLTQEGNVAAQQQLLAGLPQIQNAILGNQVDLSGLTPFQADANFDIFNRQLPDFGSIGDLDFGNAQLGSQAQAPNTPPPTTGAAPTLPANLQFPTLNNPASFGSGTLFDNLSGVPFQFGRPVSRELEEFAFGNLFNARR